MDLLEPEERRALGAGYVEALTKLAAALSRTPKPKPPPERRSSTPENDPGFNYMFGDEFDFPGMKLACARELLRLNVATAEQALKLAGVSSDDARRALDRLDTLERNKPTLGQAARYGTVGGVGGGVIGAVGNAIEHGAPLKGATPKAKALNFAANAAKGAIGGSALPLARATLDRRAEMGTLRRFMHEER